MKISIQLNIDQLLFRWASILVGNDLFLRPSSHTQMILAKAMNQLLSARYTPGKVAAQLSRSISYEILLSACLQVCRFLFSGPTYV